MARVAVAYVEVRPDLSGFGALLEAELKKHMTAGLTQAVKSTTPKASREGKKLGDAVGKAAGTALPNSMVKHFAGARHDFSGRMNAMLAHDAREAAEQAALAWRTNFGPRQLIDRTQASNIARTLVKEYGAIGAQMGRAMVREHNAEAKQLLANDKRIADAAARQAKQAADRAAAEARRTADRASREAARAAKDALRKAERAARDASRKSGARAGKDWADSFAKTMKVGINLRLGQMAPILAIVAVAAAPLAQILSSVAAGLVSLAAAAGEMAAAVGIAGVSALIAFGQAAGVAAFASQGLGDSLKALNNIQSKLAAGIALTQGDVDNYAEAMNKLSPAARNLVTALGGVGAQLTNVRRAVSQQLFAGIGGEITAIANTYLPMLQSEMSKTANVLNQAGQGFGAFMRQASTVGRVRDIMSGNTAIIRELSDAIVPLVDGALTLVRAFQPLGKMLAGYVALWSRAAAGSIDAAEKSGRLAGIVGDLQTAMAQAFAIIGQVGKALKGTFTAALPAGRLLMGMLQSLVTRWANWTNSFAGQSAIQRWSMDAIPTLQALGRLIRDIAGMFGRLASAGDAAKFVDQLRGILPPLERLLTQLSGSNAAGAFAEGIATIGRALADLGAGGTLAMAVEMIGTMLTLIVSFVQSVPGMTLAVKGLVLALAAFAAIRFTATLTGLAQLPRLIGIIDRGTGVIKAFTIASLGMTSATAKVGVFTMAATAVRDFVNGLRIARIDMIATTGAAAALRVGINGVTAAIAANPIGALLVGVGLLATAIWGISAASKGAEENTVRLNAALAKTGATRVAEEVGVTVDDLKRKIANATTYVNGFAEGPLKEVARQQVLQPLLDEMSSIETASARMADVYGSNSQVIVENLRGMGLAATTSSAEVMTAMDNVIIANKGVPISAEQMTATLAAIYQLSSKDYGQYANTFAGLNQQIAHGYGVVGEAALDSALTQITAMQLALATVGGAGGYTSNELNAQIAGIENYRKALKAQEGQISSGIGNAISGGGGGAAASKAKKAGAQTAAGWITSFTAQISELKAEDLLGHSAQWTAVGTNIATYLAKGLTSGGKNIAKVSAYISKAFGKTFIKQIQTEIGKYRAALTVFDPITGKKQGKEFWEDRLAEIKDFQNRATSALTAGSDLVNYFGFIPTPAEVQTRMTDLLNQQRKFTSDLAKLQEKGLDKDLAAAWLEAGYDTAGNLVEGLQEATPEQIKALGDTFQTQAKEAKTFAGQQATKYYGMGQTQIEKVISGINSKTTAAITAINTLMGKATTAAKAALDWTDAGKKAMDNFSSGVTSKTTGVSAGVGTAFSDITTKAKPDAKKTGKSLAEAMMEGYQKALVDSAKTTHKIIQAVLKGDEAAARNLLKATSPSQVWADIGTDTMAGYIEGVAKMQTATLSTVSGVMDAVTATPPATLTPPTVRPAYATPGTAGYPAGQTPEINVRVYVGDREIADIVRTEVTGYDNTRARALLAGRRGG